MSYIGASPTNTAFVTDTFNGTGSTTAFTMSVAPASTSSIIVAVTGVLQDPSTYSVSGTTLTFSAAPPSGTGNISVRYLGVPASGVTTTAYRTVTEFTATAGQTSFSVPSYTVGYIDVYRNGARLGSADYTASTGTTVVLASACNAGDLVQTVSFYVSSVLNAIPATAGAVNSTYITDAAVTQAKLGAGATIKAASSGSGSAAGVSSNVYTNIVSSITLPANSMVVATFRVSTSGSNNPSDATYAMYISTTSISTGVVASQDGVNVYPKGGVASVRGTLMYFNTTGSTQSVWLAGYPYASANYNTPDYFVTYYIVSFS